MSDPKEIAKTLRRRRRELDITLTQLGKKVGLSAGFISEFENGKKDISLDNFLKVVSALGLVVHFALKRGK